MTIPEITLPPLHCVMCDDRRTVPAHQGAPAQECPACTPTFEYARLAMAPLQERIEQHKLAFQEMAVAHSVQQERAEKAEAELAALRAGEKVLVPKEPTLAMLNALDDLEGVGKHYVESFDKARRNSYQRMLAAAPVVDGKAQEPDAYMVHWWEVIGGSKSRHSAPFLTDRPPFQHPDDKAVQTFIRADPLYLATTVPEIAKEPTVYPKMKPRVYPLDDDTTTDTRAKALEEADKRDAERWRKIRKSGAILDWDADGVGPFLGDEDLDAAVDTLPDAAITGNL